MVIKLKMKRNVSKGITLSSKNIGKVLRDARKICERARKLQQGTNNDIFAVFNPPIIVTVEVPKSVYNKGFIFNGKITKDRKNKKHD